MNLNEVLKGKLKPMKFLNRNKANDIEEKPKELIAENKSFLKPKEIKERPKFINKNKETNQEIAVVFQNEIQEETKDFFNKIKEEAPKQFQKKIISSFKKNITSKEDNIEEKPLWKTDQKKFNEIDEDIIKPKSFYDKDGVPILKIQKNHQQNLDFQNVEKENFIFNLEVIINQIFNQKGSERVNSLKTLSKAISKDNFQKHIAALLEILTIVSDSSEVEVKTIHLFNDFFLNKIFCELIKEELKKGDTILKDFEVMHIIKILINLKILLKFILKHSFYNTKTMNAFPVNSIIDCLDQLDIQVDDDKIKEKIKNLQISFQENKNQILEMKKNLLKKEINPIKKEENSVLKVNNTPNVWTFNYRYEKIISIKDFFYEQKQFFPHIIINKNGNKYESWEQYLNNMFYLLKEVKTFFLFYYILIIFFFSFFYEFIISFCVSLLIILFRILVKV